MRHRAASAALALLLLAAAGAARSETVSTQAGKVQVDSLVRLDNPWGMAFLVDGRLLVTEKPGRLRIYDLEEKKLSEPLGGVPEVMYRGQGGLLDVAVLPDALGKRDRVYLSYSERAKTQPHGATNQRDPRLGDPFDDADAVLKGAAVARGRLAGNQLIDVEVIWRQDPKTIGRGHFGGRLVFSPDGKLFVTSGDRQRFEPAQDLGSNLGKIVRIHAADGTVPNDNPFVGKAGARPEVWSYGHRNPLAAAIHPDTGKLWIVEMGPKGGDEIQIAEPGRNYGWPLVSEGDHYDGTPIPRHATRPDLTAPIRSWSPVISPSGLIFYDGKRFPAWKGNAFVGGLSSRALIRLTLAGEEVREVEVIDMRRRIRDVIQARDGAILLISDGADGELLRLAPATDASSP